MVDERAPQSGPGDGLEGTLTAHHDSLRALRASSLSRAQRRDLMGLDDEEDV